MEPLDIVNFVLSLTALGAAILAYRAISKVPKGDGS
ncbi:conserved hypothetical protein [Arthrobacter sp. 9V]|nr:conserved hypothetical protein [Arthrobacter sp. 9V]